MYSRRSGNTKGISDYIAKFGQELGLQTYQDEAGNVIIWKPASPGYENAPCVMLTGHMDMICSTLPEIVHDFDTQPLHLMLESNGDTIHADGTTLGADCGIGLAFIMAVLESEQIAHPPVEAVFTTNEETDMSGAMHLHYELLKSKIIFSLDATRLSLGGAGELDLILKSALSWERVPDGYLQKQISVDGLLGGHSGKNAMVERGNAVTLLARILSGMQEEIPFYMISFTGGSETACAFARSAACTIAFPEAYRHKVPEAAKEWDRIYRSELTVPDPDVHVDCRDVAVLSPRCCSLESSERLLNLLTILPDGVCSLHKYFPGKYEVCVNVGVVEMETDAFRVLVCVRSAVKSKKTYQASRIRRICQLLNVQYSVEHDLPQWDYCDTSALVQKLRGIYGEDCVSVAQGTSEQGIFLAHMSGAQAIGVGPVVHNPHSPYEHISVKEISEDWNRFCEALAAIDPQTAKESL